MEHRSHANSLTASSLVQRHFRADESTYTEEEDRQIEETVEESSYLKRCPLQMGPYLLGRPKAKNIFSGSCTVPYRSPSSVPLTKLIPYSNRSVPLTEFWTVNRTNSVPQPFRTVRRMNSVPQPTETEPVPANNLFALILYNQTPTSTQHCDCTTKTQTVNREP